MGLKILGTGSALPSNMVTNEQLTKMVDTSDEWIASRTGIRQRHISTGETTTELCVRAARRALENAGMQAEELELIVVATLSGDRALPNTGCEVQRELNAVHATAFEINAACSGFLFALNTVQAYMAAGLYRKALVIGGEVLSKLVDWQDRNTCVLFGDGAGAAVVEADPAPDVLFRPGKMTAAGRGAVLSGKTVTKSVCCDRSRFCSLYLHGRPGGFPVRSKKSAGDGGAGFTEGRSDGRRRGSFPAAPGQRAHFAGGGQKDRGAGQQVSHEYASLRQYIRSQHSDPAG